MKISYKIWTEKDIQERNLTEPGSYKFEILDVKQKETSGIDKNGNSKEKNQMLEIEFSFVDNNGVVKKQKDWIVLSDEMSWKLRHLAESVDLLDVYEDGELNTQNLINRKGVFNLDQKLYKDKKINYVKDYFKVNVYPKASILNPIKSDSIYNDIEL